VIKIFVDFTEQEKAQIEAIEEKYQKAFKAIDEIKDSRTDEPPQFLQPIKYPEKTARAEIERIKKENDAISAANDKFYKEWEAAGSPEWLAARCSPLRLCCPACTRIYPAQSLGFLQGLYYRV